jgi:polysaccharide export outer membrane protein
MKRFPSYPSSFFLLFILNFLILFNTSCVSKSKINYFQNKTSAVDSTKQSVLNRSYTPTLKVDDFISVDVSAVNEESIKPFLLTNIPVGGQVPAYTNGVAAPTGYLIDANGEIMLPIIGKIKLAGLNRMEATELIQSKLSDYIQNPVVNIRIQNFKITVLGDVKNPGSYTIPNERITLLEAIGIAGDLNMTGVRETVLVIRDSNGVKTQFTVDLTSNAVFQSPVYYLEQNDVVYVEPNRPKRNSSLVSSTTGVFISITSLIITTITLITRN